MTGYRSIAATLALTLALFAAGCGEDNISGPGEEAETYTDFETRIENNNEFAVSLYGEVTGEKDGNFMISPFSTEVAFAMVYAGARDRTESEIAGVMNFHYPQENGFHPAMRTLQDEILSRGWHEQEFTIRIANGCWIDDHYEVLQAFQDTLTLYYDAEIDTLPLALDPEGSRAVINDWIYDRVRISEAFPPGSIDPSSVLVLANTFTFSAKWMKCFDPDYTWDGQFRLLDGSTVTVPFMHGEDNFDSFDGDGFDALRLPYEGEQVSMLLLLPDAGEFEAFEYGLDPSMIADVYDSLETGFTRVTLPRFSISTDLDLISILYDMGMTSAFGFGADFSGIDGTDDGIPWISTVIHKTRMWVNEHGTGAFAMTGMVMTVGIVPHFDAVRPFIFAIVDEPTGTILFLGRVMEANGGPPPIDLQ